VKTGAHNTREVIGIDVSSTVFTISLLHIAFRLSNGYCENMNSEQQPESAKHRKTTRQSLPETILTPHQVKRLGQWKETSARLLKRCFLRSSTPRACIKAFCLDCCGEDKLAIRECGDRCCPLWHFRPYQRKG